MNVVGIIEREGWHMESWTEAGTHDELLRRQGVYAKLASHQGAGAVQRQWARA